MKRVMK